MQNKYVLIIHEVSNFKAWKQIFDDAAAIRKKAGEISYQILSCETNPGKIVHFSAWLSLNKARRFFESKKLVDIRTKAGVTAPDFIYLEQLEKGFL